MHIRPATTRDARAIARVQLRGWQTGYRGMVPDAYLATLNLDDMANRWLGSLAEPKRMEHIVAEGDDESVAGWAAFGANQSDLGPDIGELGALYVDPDCWDTGIGDALLAEAEAGLRRMGYAHAVVWTLADNQRTRRFYEHRGWAFDGSTDTHRSGAQVVRYAKALGPSTGRVDPHNGAA